MLHDEFITLAQICGKKLVKKLDNAYIHILYKLEYHKMYCNNLYVGITMYAKLQINCKNCTILCKKANLLVATC